MTAFKFNLREVTDNDHEWLVHLHNDPDVLKNLTNNTAITMKHHLLWWKKISKDLSQKRLIFMVDSNRVGFTKFYNIDKINKNCVLGADIVKDFRGRGFAKPMWKLMLDYCKNLGLYRVSLTTAEYNIIGQKVYLDLGFSEEGRHIKSLYRDGEYFDQICMYKIIS